MFTTGLAGGLMPPAFLGGSGKTTRKKPLPPISVLVERFSYNPETGEFRHAKRPKGRPNAAGKCGALGSDGLLYLSIGRSRFLAHRVAWKMIYGVDPICLIDHINGDKQDNRIANLRDVSHAVNQQNMRKPMKNSTTGFLGVRYAGGKYVAKIVIGSYNTAEEAHIAYLIAKRLIHPGCTI